MNCFQCAKTNDPTPAVAICQHCGVGLCLDHLAEARDRRVGGTVYGCDHEIPRTQPMRGLPAGIAATSRHRAAGAA